MKNIVYQELELNEEQILNLYDKNGWSSYTNNLKGLIDGIKSSLYSYAAYDENKLVGLIRVVGDASTIIYIEDLLVLPEYRRQRIGTKLIGDILEKYKNVNQIILTTDKSDSRSAFYESLGFVSFDKLKLAGFYYIKK